MNAVEESAFTEAQLLGYENSGISSVSRKHYITALSGKEWQKELKKEWQRYRKEKLVIARQMKVDGLPYDTISKYTGLPVEKIEKRNNSSLPCPRELLRYGDGELAADSQFTFQPDTSSVCTNYFVDKSQA